MFTTCSRARSCEWSLEAITIRACRKFCTTSQGLARWEDPFLQTSKKRATSATTSPAGIILNREILDELAETLGNFRDSARALASCLQNRDVSRKTDQSIIKAAKCMFHKLLGEANDDLERVTPRSHESLHIELRPHGTNVDVLVPRHRVRNLVPVPRHWLRNLVLVPRHRARNLWQTPTDGTPRSVPIPPSPPDRSGIHVEKLESESKRQPSSEPKEQVVDGDFRKQLVLSVPQHDMNLESGHTNWKCRRSL